MCILLPDLYQLNIEFGGPRSHYPAKEGFLIHGKDANMTNPLAHRSNLQICHQGISSSSVRKLTVIQNLG